MTTLVLGVAGAVVGGMFGMPMLGFAMGSMLGSAIGPQPNSVAEGPRLSDLRVQSSAQGQPIFRLYGAMRLAGNMIWSLPIKEARHESRQSAGGKGGGPSVTSVTYTYSQSFAIGLCEGPVIGVRKIWANGKLIYNASADADDATLIASDKFAQGFVVYPGTETQNPDPTIQAAVGADNCPAYRGLAYIVFNDLQLADYNNATPNLEFEVVVNGEADTRRVDGGPGPLMRAAHYNQHLTGFDYLPDEMGSYALADFGSNYYSMGLDSAPNYSSNVSQILAADLVVSADFSYSGTLPEGLEFATDGLGGFYLYDPSVLEPGHTEPAPWRSSSEVGYTNIYAYFYNPGSYKYLPFITVYPASLADVVADICKLSGLTSGQIDVSQLTDDVPGYAIPQRQTGRAGIEPLQFAFFFDAVESDGKLKFVKRGQSPVVNIPEDDLAARPYGNQAPDNLTTIFQQETELPHEVSIAYFETESAYANGMQYARRLVGRAQQTVTLNLSMSLSAAKARQIAEVSLWNAWMARITATGSVNRKYACYEPTDVTTLHKGDITHTMRIVGKNEAGGVITLDLAREDASIYTQSLAATSQTPPSESLAPAPGSETRLLDIPLLRDIDDGPGFYMAACASQDPSRWNGMQLFRSLDGGATWDTYGPTITHPSNIGTAANILGDFDSGNIFDELNAVTVTLRDGGSLASVSELLVLSGSNAAILGNEIIQYKTAELISANTYRLSGLLRGRRGTEWATASHLAGERFVALSSGSLMRVVEGAADLGLSRAYRGVTVSALLTDASGFGFTDTGVSLKPYAPVQLGAGRDGSGNMAIQWVRRTRTGGEWRDSVDAPVGEATEAYEVEIWSSDFSTLKRTLTGISTPAASYSAANQTTDFGSLPASVGVRVYQLSAAVGRGYPAAAVL